MPFEFLLSFKLHHYRESAESAGIAIYSISSHTHRVRTDGDAVLHQLAAATGGRSFVAANPPELQTALAIIQGELRNSYLLYYRMQEQPDARKFRSIKLVPTARRRPRSSLASGLLCRALSLKLSFR